MRSSLPFNIRPPVPADARALAETHVRAWLETYTGLMDPAVLEANTVDFRTARWERILADPDNPGRTVIAETLEGEVVGFAGYGPPRDADWPADSEIWGINLIRPVYGTGLAQALVASLAREMIDRGHHSTGLWVVRGNNRACRFYDKLGGRVVPGLEKEGPGGTWEIAYLWASLPALLEAAERGR